MGERVLVTGGSGFIGAHTIVQALNAGHQVTTTIRSPARQDEVRTVVRAGGADPSGLTFKFADLMKDEGWADAVAGQAYVLHVASPFPPTVPKHEDELIVPAREGTLRVLKAAKAAGVKRVVVTSSMAAVAYGHAKGKPDRPYTENDWTDPNGLDVRAYVKSKTIAERAAWDWARANGQEMAVVNPSAVLGPVLGQDYSTSIELVKKLMEAAMPGCPRLGFMIVDVRDVADLHLRAMTDPAAAGERFLACSGDFMWMQDVAHVLRDRMGDAARKVPTGSVPDWLVRFLSNIDPVVKQIVPELGRERPCTSEKAQRLLGWAPRSPEDAIVATAESLVALGMVKGLAKAA
ncbi:MAG: NAD-dependent epimerase/dehydratase family protein [Alphaproteobacteria bacterium]|nr:NAD-dependent epimerase/dehydratase family protein [Alphaproteobacteria bacterium]